VATETATTFLIQSVRPGGRLEFQWTRPAHIAVKLQDQGLAASSEIHAIVSGPADLPTAFFDSLAESWRGWRGTKDWSSYERDLEFAAAADGKDTSSCASSSQLAHRVNSGVRRRSYCWRRGSLRA